MGQVRVEGHRCDDVASCENTQDRPSIGYMMLELEVRKIGKSREVGARVVVNKVNVPESGGTKP